MNGMKKSSIEIQVEKDNGYSIIYVANYLTGKKGWIIKHRSCILKHVISTTIKHFVFVGHNPKDAPKESIEYDSFDAMNKDGWVVEWRCGEI